MYITVENVQYLVIETCEAEHFKPDLTWPMVACHILSVAP